MFAPGAAKPFALRPTARRPFLSPNDALANCRVRVLTWNAVRPSVPPPSPSQFR